MRLRLRVLPALALIAALLFAGAIASPAHAQSSSPSSPPPPAATVACGVSYEVTADWGTGFMASATVTNLGTVPIRWQVTIVFGRGTSITHSWNGEVVVDPPNTIIIEPPAWLPALAPGSSHSAGFIATGGSTPSSIGITCWAA